MNITKLSSVLSLVGMSLLLVSCSHEESETPEIQGTVIQQAVTNSETASVLDKFSKDFQYQSSFNIDEKNMITNQGYCIVNSKDEIEAFSQGVETNYRFWLGNVGGIVNYVLFTNINESSIPEIDYSRNSLVLGKHLVSPSKGEKEPLELVKQTFYKTSSSYILELQYTYDIVETPTYATKDFPFWGIYPKLENLPIELRIKYVD